MMKKRLLALVLALAMVVSLVVVPVGAEGDQALESSEAEETTSLIPDDAQEWSGHCYYVFEDFSYTWEEAEAYCESLGGYLATITSEEEQEFICSILQDKYQYWLGATDVAEEGTWTWVTGEAFEYTNWKSGEPNNDFDGTEDYLGIYTSSLKWNDFTNDALYADTAKLDITGFICEWGDYTVSSDETQEWNGHYYYVFEDFSYTWEEAEEYCESLGGYLATITSEEEQEFICSILQDKYQYWLGATDVAEEGTWTWVTGEAFEYTNWASGMPDNGFNGTEDYLGIYTSSLKWNDFTNDALYGGTSITGFICEWGDTGGENDESDTDFFELGIDTNSFNHSWNTFYTSEYYYGSGVIYPTTYGAVLLSNCTGIFEYSSMQEKLNSHLYTSSDYDWPGMCFGISATMVISSTDRLTNIGTSTDYYSLGFPVDNAELLSQICYYQLLTDLNCFETEYKTCNSSLANLVTSSVSLSRFLTALKNEAERCQEESSPFMFIFNYKVKEGRYAGHTGGHAVVACGYEDINYESYGTTYSYRIKIYDPNDMSATYRYLDIAEDYSTFTFQDKNHAVSYGTYLQNDYTNMSFVGIDSLRSDIYDLSSTSSGNGGSSNGGRSSNAQVQVSMSAYSTFTLTNADGEMLTYDGETYDGTLTVYSLKESVNDTDDGTGSSGELILTVDASDYFLLTDFEDGFELAAEIDGGYYCASATGADTILLSKDDGVVIEDDSEYTFTAAISTDLDSCEQVRISGTTSGTTQLTVDEDGAVLTTENDCTGTTVETYIGTDYEVKTIDGTTVKVAISDDSNGETNVEVTEGATNPFTDVNTGHYFYNAVLWAVDNGITSGTSDTTFSPFLTAERCQVVTFLWRAAGCPEVAEGTENPFTDVDEDDYFYTAVLWAVENGITTGTSATTFSPYNKCERCQVVTFLYRYFDEPEVTTSENPFTDVDTDDYFYNAVLWAVENGITSGMTATTFGPFVTCERCMVVTFLYRALVS